MTNNTRSDKTENLESLLNAILDATPDLIFAKDKDFNYIAHNKAFANLVCPTGTSLVGKSDHQIFSNQASVDKIRKLDEHILQSGETVTNQETTVSPDGKVAKVDTLKAPFYNEAGEMLGLIGISRDITKRVNAEQALSIAKEKAEAANQAKSDFLAKMSHEIRTPMNAIIGLSQLLQRSRLDVSQRDQVNKILNSAEVLLNQINDILDLSKIEVDKLKLDHAPFSLPKVLERTVTLCELKAIEKRLEFAIDIPGDLPAGLLGDANRLQQVLVNLANNAIKFTESGHVLIKVSKVAQRTDSLTLQFTVEDTGIGISEEEQARLFVAFEQIDNSLTRNYQGSGLGLVICKQIVEMMGSSIHLTSRKGQGTAFSFDLDFAIIESGETTKHCESLSQVNALVVDDSAVARGIVAELLSQFGVKVTTASNGHEAIEQTTRALANQQDFDLVIMDWRMPQMDGIQAAEQIKKIAGHNHIPAILLLSAYDLDEAKCQPGAPSIDAYLEKPITPESLRQALQQSLTLSGNPNDGPNNLANPFNHSAWDTEQLDFANARILVVDDNSINRQVVRGFLSEANLIIDEASNGQQAIDMLHKQAYDLVLMDIQMPKLDGYSTTQRLRDHQRFSQLPIIAMTAHAMEADIQRSKQAGMNAHIAKPIDPMALNKVLMQFITHAKIKPSRQNIRRKPTRRADAQVDLIGQLEHIPHINTVTALQRCLNDKNLYCKLIEDFIAENRSCVDVLSQARAEQNNETLFAQTHSLKSGLAYIGAFDLSEQCAEIERIIHHKTNEDYSQTLDDLIQQLNAMLKDLNHACNTKPINTPRPGPALRHQLQTLLPLLEESDFSAEAMLDGMKAEFLQSTYISDIHQIAEQVEAVEFERAHQLCLALLDKAFDGGR